MKPIVTVKGDYETGYSVSVGNSTYGIGRGQYQHHLCEMIQNQGERLEHQSERIQDLQIEVEQANKKLRQFKRTFVEARALHDLRNFVVRHLHDQRKTSRMLPEVAEAHKNVIDRFDMEMRRFIKQYQDRVEAWPADAPKPPLSEDEVPVQVKHAFNIEPQVAPWMLRANLPPVTDVQAMNRGVPKKEKHQVPRVRYFRWSSQLPNGHKQVGYLRHDVSRDDFVELVTQWKNRCSHEGCDIGMVIAWDSYIFYKVPRREQN